MLNKVQLRSRKNRSGYEITKGLIKPIAKIGKHPDGTDTRTYEQTLQVVPNDLFKEFLKILDPVYELGISSPEAEEYDELTMKAVERQILSFANTYGMDEKIANSDKFNWEDSEFLHSDPDEADGFFVEKEEYMEQTTVQGLIDEAWELMNVVRNNDKWIQAVSKRLNSAYPLRTKISTTKGNVIVGLCDSVIGSVWWSYFYSSFDFKVKECGYCKKPMIHDARARFCPPPSQCKNKFHNEKARKEKSKNADK